VDNVIKQDKDIRSRFRIEAARDKLKDLLLRRQELKAELTAVDSMVVMHQRDMTDAQSQL